MYQRLTSSHPPAPIFGSPAKKTEEIQIILHIFIYISVFIEQLLLLFNLLCTVAENVMVHTT